MLEKKIGFVGAGNLAEALIKGILKGGLVPPGNVFASDVRGERLEDLAKTYGIFTTNQNREVVEKSDLVILAVKPQTMQGVLGALAPAVDESKLVISVAAGVPISTMVSLLDPAGNKGLKIIRVMPNTPALVQEGAAALAKSPSASESDLDTALKLFNAVGKTVVVEESLMDAVTGLSGSGPAYICLVLESLADAGVKMGLPRDISFKLSLQTILGTVRLIEETGKPPSELREMVTSPGGTTIHGLHALEKGKLKDTIINAVEAATQRAKELGKE